MRASAVAVIVAAGPGTRLGAGVPKALVELAGTPLVIHSLRALLNASSIESAVVVVSLSTKGLESTGAATPPVVLKVVLTMFESRPP